MDWPHAPLHRFVEGDAIYFVTAATYLKQHFYRTAKRLDGQKEEERDSQQPCQRNPHVAPVNGIEVIAGGQRRGADAPWRIE